MEFREFFSKQTAFFQIWCICHSNSSSPSSTVWLNIGRALHLLSLITILIICTIYERNVFAQGSPVSKFVDIIQLVLPLSTHIIVILEGFLKRQKDREIRELMDKVESELQRQRVNLVKFDKTLKRRYYTSMIIVQSISLIMEITIIATITESPDWMRNWFARVISFVLTRMAIFHYNLTVEYLSSRLKVLIKELMELQEYCNGNQLNTSHDSYLCKRIEMIKRTHLNLWRISDIHNDRHSIFILVAITSFFLCLTIDFYWMYANLYYGDNIFIARELNFFCEKWLYFI